MILLGLFLLSSIHSAELSLTELGAGLFFFNLPHYRGSNQSKSYLWPLPYIIYRGDTIQAKNSFISGKLFEEEDLELGLSLNASLNVNSEENRAREGMPNLDPAIEIGPVLHYDLWKDSQKKNIISLHLPIRKVLTGSFSRLNTRGTFMVPYIAFAMNPQRETLGLFLGFSFAYMYASRRYHSYYYTVSPQFSREDRKTYYAQSGSSGFHTTAFVSKKIKRFYLFSFLRYDSLRDASFRDSPLVKRKDYFAWGLGMIWYFFRSDEKVSRKYNR